MGQHEKLNQTFVHKEEITWKWRYISIKLAGDKDLKLKLLAVTVNSAKVFLKVTTVVIKKVQQASVILITQVMIM